ncbi:hypothetical protein CC86DRAFT_417164 [Ophiobolus disseminans]|uniref:Prion-inhibition and propagation HeLo domain-containing protein n=1 Tax=Ophiobolus disseminans TaxID=1469910 RepID=A0A6A7A044_9PLEO|nr:hypothetical protein CC86DRAFT_417164 [Ophiobolus disseminans]
MDAASLAFSIVALYTTCRDCYNFYTTQSILKAWGFHWQIQKEENVEPGLSVHTRRKQTRLHEYLLSNRYKAEAVFKTLSALADTLSDQEKLVKRYGIHFQQLQSVQSGLESSINAQLAISSITVEDVEPVINEVKRRLSVLKKFKWALKDKTDFKKLILELRSHSDSLYRLCPENAFEARQESPASLKWTSRIATQQAEVYAESSVRRGYELLASAATLKASVNENRGEAPAVDGPLPGTGKEQREMRYLGKGLALFEENTVYVEMRDYCGPPPLKFTKKRRHKVVRFLRSTESEKENPIELVRPPETKNLALIRNFANTFQGVSMRDSVYGLDIAGMIEHTDGEHKGYCSILYKLPGTIGVQNRERPAENLRLRAPVTLQSILGENRKHEIRSTLGTRFDLARRLVRAVCLLHSSGWLHKNIRAESVIFFPEHVNTLQEDRYELKIEIDVSKPILMGYIFSRPDDIITQSKNVLPSPETRIKFGGIPGVISSLQRPKSYATASYVDPVAHRATSKRRSVTPRSHSIHGYNMTGKNTAPVQTKETIISGFMLDYYQHPTKHANPVRLYRHAYDVYSLGILLLEIGLWEKLKDYEETITRARPTYPYEDDESSDLEEEDHYEHTYADVVLSCLMIDSSDDKLAKASERELCARIVADLEGCQA